MLKATLLFSVIAIRRVSSVDSDIPVLNRFAVKKASSWICIAC